VQQFPIDTATTGGRQAAEARGSMTPRERIVAVLRGEMPDRIPFTIKRPQPQRGEVERKLRNEGLAVCIEELPFTTRRPNVEVVQRESWKNGRTHIEETLHTPVGQVTQEWIVEPGYNSRHRAKFPVARPEDYAVVEFIMRDEVYTPAFDAFRREERILGEDGLVFGGWLEPTPLLRMLWELLGTETFCVDMVEHPREFRSLYDALFEKQRERVQLVAESPALVAHLNENLSGEMLGPKRFEEYVLPVYEEYRAILRPKGKLLAAHCDGLLKSLAEPLAHSALDIIEAFCPFPNSDMTMAEARRQWPDKIIWINFPSPLHLQPPERMDGYVRDILEAAAPCDRFLFGITEDIPEGVWQMSLPAISKALLKYGKLPLSIG
jgi:hypothetical protein